MSHENDSANVAIFFGSLIWLRIILHFWLLLWAADFILAVCRKQHEVTEAVLPIIPVLSKIQVQVRLDRQPEFGILAAKLHRAIVDGFSLSQ